MGRDMRVVGVPTLSCSCDRFAHEAACMVESLLCNPYSVLSSVGSFIYEI